MPPLMLGRDHLRYEKVRLCFGASPGGRSAKCVSPVPGADSRTTGRTVASAARRLGGWKVQARNAGGPARARQPSEKVRGGAAPPVSAGDRRRHPRSKYRSHCLARQTHLPREREKPGVDRTRVPRPAQVPSPSRGKRARVRAKRPNPAPSPKGKGQRRQGQFPGPVPSPQTGEGPG